MKEICESDRQLLFNFFNSAAPLTDELFGEMLEHFSKKSYKKGDFILKIGEIETKANLVVKGVVHQYIYDEDVPITINITPKGLPCNSLKSYLNGTPSLEVHEAITDVELVFIGKDDLDSLARKNHEFAYIMFKVFENILLDRENRMFLLQYKNPTKRFMLFHDIVQRSSLILENTPDKYIANYLNMTPQQYSKEKKKMLNKL